MIKAFIQYLSLGILLLNGFGLPSNPSYIKISHAPDLLHPIGQNVAAHPVSEFNKKSDSPYLSSNPKENIRLEALDIGEEEERIPSTDPVKGSTTIAISPTGLQQVSKFHTLSSDLLFHRHSTSFAALSELYLLLRVIRI
ncbi:MAG: hypothetical protein V7724_08175 [Sediminicola sp.]